MSAAQAAPPAARPPEFPVGRGKISAALSVTLGALTLLGVLCFRYPEWFTTPDLRGQYPVPLLRSVLHGALIAGLTIGAVGVLHGVYRGWAALGVALAALALALGGASVPVATDVADGPNVGLDWFVLNLFATGLVFIPIERLAPRDPTQRVFRRGFRTDLGYFAMSHLLVEASVILATVPATTYFAWAVVPEVQAVVRSCPAWLQILLAALVADLTAYWVHRLCHKVPFLWRFHAVHHESVALDWLAASRLHLIDIVLTRGITFVPLFLLGFEQAALAAYLGLVALHAVFNHANVRFGLRVLDGIVTTPRFHHWHHAAEAEAVDTNFAVQFPFLDRLFGTFHLPARWPREYGLRRPQAE